MNAKKVLATVGRPTLVGLALFAVSALGIAGGLSTALADFGSSYTGGPTFLTGFEEEELKLTVNGRTVTCHETSFSGETVESLGGGTWNGLALDPKFENCTAFGLPATVDKNTCRYRLTTVTPTHGLNHVHCTTPGDSITVTVFSSANHTQAPVCTYHYPQQTNTGPTYTNLNGDLGFGVNMSVASIVTGPLLTCGANGERTGTLTGSVRLSGYNSASHSTQVNIESK